MEKERQDALEMAKEEKKEIKENAKAQGRPTLECINPNLDTR